MTSNPDPKEVAEAVERAGSLAVDLKRYADDYADARTWGGPTIAPTHPVDEKRAREAAAALHLILALLTAKDEEIARLRETDEHIAKSLKSRGELTPLMVPMWICAICAYDHMRARAEKAEALLRRAAEVLGLFGAAVRMFRSNPPRIRPITEPVSALEYAVDHRSGHYARLTEDDFRAAASLHAEIMKEGGHGA